MIFFYDRKNIVVFLYGIWFFGKTCMVCFYSVDIYIFPIFFQCWYIYLLFIDIFIRYWILWCFFVNSQFLIGLEKYGKGDWRSISRHLVVTRTPTQVASHAQKYFSRLNSKNKNKTRQRIHDRDVGSSNTSAMQSPNTWQNTQATSQPSQDHHPTYSTPTLWNTQATLQQSQDHPMYGTPTKWNMQAASQPSVNIPIYGTHTVNQSMVGRMVSPFGSNMNRLAPPHIFYGVQHHSAPYSSVSRAPYSSVPSAPFNMAASYNMTYAPTSR